MQMVIDIPEEVYNLCVRHDYFIFHESDIIRQAIAKGTTLPKGHGDIIDRDEIAFLTAMHKAKCGYISWGKAIRRIKYSAPTIVEADKQTSGCSSCSHSGSIIDGYKDCPDAYTEQSQYCGLNNKEE